MPRVFSLPTNVSSTRIIGVFNNDRLQELIPTHLEEPPLHFGDGQRRSAMIADLLTKAVARAVLAQCMWSYCAFSTRTRSPVLHVPREL